MARSGQRGYGNAGRSAYSGGTPGAQSRAVFAADSGNVPAPAFPLTLSGPNQTEGNSGTTAFTFVLGRGNGGTYVYTWAVTPIGANPANAADFGGAFPSGSGTITAAETSKNIVVNVAGDVDFEPNETFLLTVSIATYQDGTIVGTIFNDDSSGGGAGAPVASGNPTIAGGNNEGDTLVATPPMYSNMSAPSSFVRYQWTRDGVAIPLATKPAYTRRGDDVGKALAVQTYGVNASGVSVASATAAAATVAAAALGMTYIAGIIGAANVYDLDAAVNVTADGSSKVSAWANKTSGGTGSHVQATLAAQPTLAATGWGNSLPAVQVLANSTQFQALTSSGAPLFDLQGTYAVLRRAAAQTSLSTTKNWFEWYRPTDSLRTQVVSANPTTQPAQNTLGISPMGGGSGSVTTATLTGGVAAIMTDRQEASRHRGGWNGENPFQEGNSASTTTSALDAIGGVTTNTGARFDLARFIRVNLDAFAGGVGQRAHSRTIEGMLAWKYGIIGDANTDFVAALNANHKFKARAPSIADFLNRAISIGAWGNSITNGYAGQLGTAMGYNDTLGGNLGASCQNSGYGGANANEILNYFLQGFDVSPGGTSSGLSLQRQREKVTVIGDLYTNGLGAPVGLASATSVFDAISQMVAACETAQGASAGNGRIVVLGRYRTTSNGYSGDPATDAVEIADAQLKAAFPNYFCKFSEALWQAGAPDGPYPDAAAFANQACPTVLRSDTTHPTSQGYQVQGQYIAAFIRSKGWDRP